MLNTTLCYITRGDQVLMLHRIKKQNDINKDKWIGIGGKFEGEETPDECLLREAYEETGLTLTSWQCRGIVTFLNDCCEGEFMYLFTADGFTEGMRRRRAAMGKPGFSGQPAQMGGRQDLSGAFVAGRAVLFTEAALQWRPPDRSRPQRKNFRN